MSGTAGRPPRAEHGLSHTAAAVQLRKRNGTMTPSDEPGDPHRATRIDPTTH